jgi:Ca2+-binding EF-hand superfamily protein
MKKMMTKTAMALVAAGFVTAVVAGEDAFIKLDANADGYISAEEAASSETLSQSWETTDANRDGQVDAAEFSAFEAMVSEPKE